VTSKYFLLIFKCMIDSLMQPYVW